MTNKLKSITVIGMAAAAVLVTTPSFAKVPYRGNSFAAERTASAATETQQIRSTGSPVRFGKAAVASEKLEVCTHTHRFSHQHKM